MSQCPRLQRAKASVSGPWPQQQRPTGPRANPQGAVVCYKCGQSGHISRNCSTVICFHCNQPGHTVRDCPTKMASSQSASTGQVSRAPAQSSRGGGRGRGQHRGGVAAMEMTEEFSGFQQQPAQMMPYVYPPPPQTYYGGGGYWPGQMDMTGQSNYTEQPHQPIPYVQSPSSQPAQRGVAIDKGR